MRRQTDLNRAVNVIPVGVMILLISARGDVAHEVPGALKIRELEISCETILLEPPARMVFQLL
jgi:hypothetical protein